MAENLEALNDKWYHILEERQSNLLDTEHENQDDENHSSLYLGYYQEIMDEISDGKFFDSNDTGMTDQAVDRKIKQKLDELNRLENDDHEEYTSSLQKSYGSYNSESEGELDGSGVYKGPVEYTDDEIYNLKSSTSSNNMKLSSPKKKTGKATDDIYANRMSTNTTATVAASNDVNTNTSTTTATSSSSSGHNNNLKFKVKKKKKKKKHDNSSKKKKSTKKLIKQQNVSSDDTLNIKYLGSDSTSMIMSGNKNSNQLEEEIQQLEKQDVEKQQQQQKLKQGEVDFNDISNVTEKSNSRIDEIMEKKNERTRETKLLEKIGKAVDHRIAHGPKKYSKSKGGCAGGGEDGWFNWLNCGVDDRDGDSD